MSNLSHNVEVLNKKKISYGVAKGFYEKAIQSKPGDFTIQISSIAINGAHTNGNVYAEDAFKACVSKVIKNNHERIFQMAIHEMKKDLDKVSAEVKKDISDYLTSIDEQMGEF